MHSRNTSAAQSVLFIFSALVLQPGSTPANRKQYAPLSPLRRTLYEILGLHPTGIFCANPTNAFSSCSTSAFDDYIFSILLSVSKTSSVVSFSCSSFFYHSLFHPWIYLGGVLSLSPFVSRSFPGQQLFESRRLQRMIASSTAVY